MMVIAVCFSVCIALHIFIFCEGGRRNLAVNKPATQISQHLDFVAGRANDGIDGTDVEQGGCSHTAGYAAPVAETHPWWEVDLLQENYISAVAISSGNYSNIFDFLSIPILSQLRHISISTTGVTYIITHRITDVNLPLDLPQLLHDFSIKIYRDGETINDALLCNYHVGLTNKGTTELYLCKNTIKGRHVRITINGTVAEMLILCEVKVIGSKYSTTTSFTKFDDGDPEFPDMKYNVQGYGQCAMKCYVLPMCQIFSVKLMSDYYQCNIFVKNPPKLVGNSTGSPGTDVFMI